MLSVGTVSQLIVIGIAVACGILFAHRLRRRLHQLSEQGRLPETGVRALLVDALKSIMFPLVFVSVLLLYMLVSLTIEGLDIAVGEALPRGITKTLSEITMAWLAISTVSHLLPNRQISRLFGAVIWVIVALHLLDWWQVTLDVLTSVGYTFGKVKVTPLTFIKALLVFGFLFWLYSAVTRIAEKRIWEARDLNPSVKVLLVKFTKIGLSVVVVILGMNALGLDLTTLTVFSGAAGLGLGFGLQKVFSNYISGIILLLDRSIKPGDVIWLDNVNSYGWVKSLSGRYVCLITRDGTEHLIPNELLITERVINWSHSDKNVRVKIKVGVSYRADVEKALAILEEAAQKNTRVLGIPKPLALLTGFGNSSVELELRCWIRDPINGIAPVQSQILLYVWKRFKAEGIEIPFPQRDLHLRSIDKHIMGLMSEHSENSSGNLTAA